MHIMADRLRSRHAHLDQLIALERSRPAPDPLRLQALKRRKLALKERLSAIEARSLVLA